MPENGERNETGSYDHLVTGVPDPPKLNPDLPAHPNTPKPTSAFDGASYGKAAIAASAMSSFLGPIMILCLGGYWLDVRTKHTTPWFAIGGLVLGLILGTTSLIRVLEKLSK